MSKPSIFDIEVRFELNTFVCYKGDPKLVEAHACFQVD